jgi:glyoxylase-like metal-dependent hydrolase (beta-lactamase superfamily II)
LRSYEWRSRCLPPPLWLLQITSLGGIKAIVISHPHYYTTYAEWAKTFDCPVYVSAEDEKWLDQLDADVQRKLITGATETIVEGVTAVKTGGHFDGSLVLHWEEKLFIADSLLTVQVRTHNPLAQKTTETDASLVRILSCRQTSWDYILRFYVVNSQLHTPAAG